ncbi:hypothetical protein LWI28_026485 [Acer negundo]|uniref:AAA-type ATPase N-terminal domain-containing protein n=1 Tax=Acer negundo TaxID=4023 RepID=A0AAD5IP53_ACENE|nr:hypothetical protein LWI28_026485 [Acer negundo]
MDRRKKQFRKTMREYCNALKRTTSNGEDGKMKKYKQFWSGLLSDEKKRGFQKVKIEELQRHYKWLSEAYSAIEYYLSSKSSTQAKRLKADIIKNSNQSLVLCMDDHEEVSVEFEGIKLWWSSGKNISKSQKFGDYELYRIHFWEKNCMSLKWKLTPDVGIGKESIDMKVDGVWKPVVDIDEVIKIIVNHAKSESSDTSKTSGRKTVLCCGTALSDIMVSEKLEFPKRTFYILEDLILPRIFTTGNMLTIEYVELKSGGKVNNSRASGLV